MYEKFSHWFAMSFIYSVNIIVSISATEYSDDSKRARAKLVASSFAIILISIEPSSVGQLSLGLIKITPQNQDIFFTLLGCISIYAFAHFIDLRISDIKNEREQSSKERVAEKESNIKEYGSSFIYPTPSVWKEGDEEIETAIKKRDKIYALHDEENKRLIPIRLLAFSVTMAIGTALPLYIGYIGISLSIDNIVLFYKNVVLLIEQL